MLKKRSNRERDDAVPSTNPEQQPEVKASPRVEKHVKTEGPVDDNAEEQEP